MPALLCFNAVITCFGVTRFGSTRPGSLMPCSRPSVLSHPHRELCRWAAIARTVFLGVPGITTFQSSGGRFSINSLVTRLLVRHAARRLARRSSRAGMQRIVPPLFIFDLRYSVSSAAIVLDFSAPLCLRGGFCFRTRALPAIRVNLRPTYLLSAFFCVHLRQIVFGFRRAGRSAL